MARAASLALQSDWGKAKANLRAGKHVLREGSVHTAEGKATVCWLVHMHKKYHRILTAGVLNSY